jgi:hypothetical protein
MKVNTAVSSETSIFFLPEYTMSHSRREIFFNIGTFFKKAWREGVDGIQVGNKSSRRGYCKHGNKI